MTWHSDVSLLSPSLWIHLAVYLFGLYHCLRLCPRCLVWLKDASPHFHAVVRTFWGAGKSKVLLSYVIVVCASRLYSFLLGSSSLMPAAPAPQQRVPSAITVLTYREGS